MPANPDLVKITEIFLVPSSFLVAALGTADTNLHRAAVSGLGLLISALWRMSSHEAQADAEATGERDAPGRLSRRQRILLHLPNVFLGGWAVSLVAHLALWNRPLGG